jgi:hypothetical protein
MPTENPGVPGYEYTAQNRYVAMKLPPNMPSSKNSGYRLRLQAVQTGGLRACPRESGSEAYGSVSAEAARFSGGASVFAGLKCGESGARQVDNPLQDAIRPTDQRCRAQIEERV